MVILGNTLLPIDIVHSIPADIGKIFEPMPAIDEFIEVDVAPIYTIVSTDSNFVFGVSNLFISLLIYGFFEVSDPFFNTTD